jgi:2-oxoisovalerate dehydrogenase E1 component alpha subunit
VFVCENNHYAISVPQSKQMAVTQVASRAESYGFPGRVVDGNDVLACYGAMKEAVERARAGEGPTLIEASCYRFFPHTSDDDDRSYRSREEVEDAKAKDPLHLFADYLKAQGLMDDAGLGELQIEVKAEIDAAVTEAWAAPDPDPDTLLDHIFES